MKIFNEKHINVAFNETVKIANNAINNLTEFELLNTDKTALVDSIINSIKVEKLIIDFDNREVEVKMVDIQGRYFPPGYDVVKNKKYPCARVNYSFNIISGDRKFLETRPTNCDLEVVEAEIIGRKKIKISYQTLYGQETLNEKTKNIVLNWIKKIIPQLKIALTSINTDIDNFNIKIRKDVTDLIGNKIKEAQIRKKQNDDLTDF